MATIGLFASHKGMEKKKHHHHHHRRKSSAKRGSDSKESIQIPPDREEEKPKVLSLCTPKIEGTDTFLAPRIFITFEDPSSSITSKIISIVIMSLIVLSTVNYVIATIPSYNEKPNHCSDEPNNCEPKPLKVFDVIEAVCIYAFTVDYLARMLTVAFVPPSLAGLLEEEEEKEEEKNEEEEEETEGLVRLTEETHEPSNEFELVQSKQGKGQTIIEEEEVDFVVSNTSSLSNVDCHTIDSLFDTTEEPNEKDVPSIDNVWKYAILAMNIIDLVAILPFYLELIIGGSSSGFAFVRVLRLARVFRIFKLGRYNEGVMLITRTLKASLPALSLLAFFTLLGVILFGSLIYFVEGGTWKVTDEYPEGAYFREDKEGDGLEVSPFVSIPYSFYWVMVTVTTVGYGDLYPTTSGGKLVAIVCMYCGILMLALPITVLGSNFSREYMQMHGNADDDQWWESDDEEDEEEREEEEDDEEEDEREGHRYALNVPKSYEGTERKGSRKDSFGDGYEEEEEEDSSSYGVNGDNKLTKPCLKSRTVSFSSPRTRKLSMDSEGSGNSKPMLETPDMKKMKKRKSFKLHVAKIASETTQRELSRMREELDSLRSMSRDDSEEGYWMDSPPVRPREGSPMPSSRAPLSQQVDVLRMVQQTRQAVQRMEEQLSRIESSLRVSCSEEKEEKEGGSLVVLKEGNNQAML